MMMNEEESPYLTPNGCENAGWAAGARRPFVDSARKDVPGLIIDDLTL